MIFVIWFIAVLVIFSAIYFWKVFSRFNRYGVKYLRPVPLLGNYTPVVLKKSHTVEVFQCLYNSFPNERFMGLFELMNPVTMIRDLDLIKQITVKDFEHFLDHRIMVDETVDPLFGRGLFSLKGQEWKDMRSTMSPAFTVAKMRAMVPFVVDACDLMIRSLENNLNQTKSGYIDVDSKDLLARTCNDVIASCGFGMKIDSHTDPKNMFYLHVKSSAHLSFRRVLVYLGYCSFPTLMKKLKIKLFSEKANDYFKLLFTKTILEREKKKIFRPDIIDLLMTANKENFEHEAQHKDAGYATLEESEVGRRAVNRVWSDTDLLAQAIFFFLSSVETVSTSMSFLLYEMAVNPDIQEKLLQEIRSSEAKNQTFNFDSLQNLNYLDMVISELLRKWPLGIGIDRVCTKKYNLGKPNDKATKDFVIQKGEIVLLPAWCIHRDPAYFPDPEKFDPERFSEQKKNNIKPYTYLPFGSGPRSCVASRFALCQLKVMVYRLLLHFHVSPAEKTGVPVKLAPGGVVLAMEGGHWIRFQPR